MEKRNRKFFAYKAVVFDLDGTLYFQKGLRRQMALRLLSYYGFHFWKVKELFLLKDFRSVKEHWNEHIEKMKNSPSMEDILSLNEQSVDKAQYLFVAKKYHTDPGIVERVVDKWIYADPLLILKNHKDYEIADLMVKLKEKGVQCLIFSDYPVEDKLKALELSVDGCYSATASNINELKPSPKGLLTIMRENQLDAKELLMVGDRMEKDGQSAAAAGIDYLILPSSRIERNQLYQKLYEELE